MNDAMRDLHAPLLSRVRVHTATEGDDGRGIRMGMAAGGETLNMHLGEVALPYTIPNRLSRGIYLNRHGQRFINEDTYYGHIGIQGLSHKTARSTCCSTTAATNAAASASNLAGSARRSRRSSARPASPKARSRPPSSSTTATPRRAAIRSSTNDPNASRPSRRRPSRSSIAGRERHLVRLHDGGPAHEHRWRGAERRWRRDSGALRRGAQRRHVQRPRLSGQRHLLGGRQLLRTRRRARRGSGFAGRLTESRRLPQELPATGSAGTARYWLRKNCFTG